MNDTIRMPGGGYDIRLVRKEDIIKCIDDNILDKELMLEFINQLEIDATKFLSQGRWTSLPYIGTLRKSLFKEACKKEEIQELLGGAEENLNRDTYVLFRKDLRADIAKAIKRERLYKYTLSLVVNKNKHFYKYLLNTKGELYARVICHSLYHISTYII